MANEIKVKSSLLRRIVNLFDENKSVDWEIKVVILDSSDGSKQVAIRVDDDDKRAKKETFNQLRKEFNYEKQTS